MNSLERADRRLSNMKTMLERLGIDPVAFSSQNRGCFLASAIPACQSCSVDEMCENWLAQSDAPLRRAPAFCPNAQVFVWAKEDVMRNQSL
jgi:hypothetical protein